MFEAMVRASLVSLALILLHPTAHAETTWRGTSDVSKVSGSGDVLAPGGSRLILSSDQEGKEAFFGSIASLDAAPYRGQDVALSGVLEVEEGAGTAALWIRADEARQPVAFDSTRHTPVNLQHRAQSREVRLYVPRTATHLRLGVTMTGVGRIKAASLRLQAAVPARSDVSAYDVLDAAISQIETKALNRSRVDWKAERARLLTEDLKDLPAQEAHPRIRIALSSLADRHSGHLTRSGMEALRTSANPSQPVQASVSDNVGYLRMPGLSGTDPEATRQFSASVCRRLEDMASEGLQGVIVDLRVNSGGNMWPMVSGLLPLLGEGNIGAFRDADGKVSPWKARAVGGCTADMTTTPVAVLISRSTASSGEAVATAFRARPGTRFFGQPTAGLATGNGRVPLPDGSALMLTQSNFLDRTGQLVPDRLTPDVLVEKGQDPLALARSWLVPAPE
ncbi:S41 family peptidase [Stenotrophomonas chelatiphaga]|uniref:S41 family peptidase n=1 Tax=Stenotrophomonas chelatiphaga TaxID=517011 RepID=UPI0028A043A8|nr:S41 family peptidase [Stenotrophomonas chelatiphaga]